MASPALSFIPMRGYTLGPVPSSGLRRTVSRVLTIFLTSELWFSRSPKNMPPLGAASTQAGIFPTASRSVQNVHFSTTPLVLVGYSLFSNLGSIAGRGSVQLKLLAPYGQAAMQNRQPMQRCMSIITMPSSCLLKVALVGQTRTQAGFSQWLQRTRKGFSLRLSSMYGFSCCGKACSYVSFQIHLISFFMSTLPSGVLKLGTLWIWWHASATFLKSASVLNLLMSMTMAQCFAFRAFEFCAT